MSLSLISQAWSIDLQSDLKFVLLAICDMANDDGEGYMCDESIAHKCSISPDEVQLRLKELEKLGILSQDDSNIFIVHFA